VTALAMHVIGTLSTRPAVCNAHGGLNALLPLTTWTRKADDLNGLIFY
jgi:hypothetical protein